MQRQYFTNIRWFFLKNLSPVLPYWEFFDMIFAFILVIHKKSVVKVWLLLRS